MSARLRAVLPAAEEFIPGEAIRQHYDCRDGDAQQIILLEIDSKTRLKHSLLF